MTYQSPYGCAPGLLGRLEKWHHMISTDRRLPWHGLGFVHDLELVMKLLNLEEYANWLKVHGDPEQQRFAEDILHDQATIADVQLALRHAGQEQEDPVAGVEALDREVRSVDAIREVLVTAGALAPDDEETPLPDLIRALLS